MTFAFSPFHAARLAPGRRWIALGALLAVAVAAGVVWRGARGGEPAAGGREPAPAAAASRDDAELIRLRQAAETGDADASIALGDAYAGRGRWFAALWAFQDALDRRPGDFTARFSVASALLRARLFTAAAAEFEALVRDHPESAEARAGLARVERARGRPEAALAAVTAFRAEPPADLLVERGRAAHAAGQLEVARDAYRELLAREPGNLEAHYRLGRLLLATGRRREAVTLLRRTRELAPGDADVAWALGAALHAAGAPMDEAAEALAAALRLKPMHVPALREMAALSRAAGRHREAAELLSQAIRAAPLVAEPHAELSAVMTALGRAGEAEYHRGLDLLTRDRLHDAVAAFREMAARAPADPEPVLMASLCFVKMKQNLPAVQEVARARARFPNDPQILERLAQLYVLTNDHPLARQICAEWQAADPRDPRPAWILGRMAANDGLNEEAVRLYEESLSLRPEFLDVKGDLARKLLDMGGAERLERARALLEEAIARAPGMADLHLQLGMTLQAQGELAAALDAIHRALERDPRAVPAYSALLALAPRLGRGGRAPFYGRLLRDARERAREEEQLWSRLWIGAPDPERFRAMGRFFLEEGNLTRAGYHLDIALALRPAWPEARAERERVRRLQEVE